MSAAATRPRASFGRELAGFATIQVAVSLAYFLVLPVVARAADRPEWAAIAIGQSLGILASYVVDCGWSLTGPAQVAGLEPGAVRARYLASVRARLLAFTATVPVVGVLVWLLAPSSDRLVAALMALAVGVGGLSPGWLAIGTRRPGLLMTFEAVPRLAAAAVAGVVISRGGPVTTYPLLLVLVTVGGYGALTARLARGADRTEAASAWSLVRANLPATSTVLAAGAYANATPVLASFVVPAAGVAVYSSGERLYKVGLLVVVALVSALQGWVFAEGGRPDVGRIRRALCLHLALGLVGVVVLAVAGPAVSRLLFGAHLATTGPVCAWLGLAFLAISLNSSLGRHALIPLGRTSAVTTSTVVGAVLGVPLIVLLGRYDGIAGVAAGLALSEVAVTLVQARFVVAGRLLAR